MNGSCSDSVLLSDQAFTNMENLPPHSLEESYYSCTKTPRSAILGAIGIAVGNISAIMPILFVFCVQLYFSILYFRGVAPLQTYSKDEREDCLKGLALQLLMMRDHRLPPTRGILPPAARGGPGPDGRQLSSAPSPSHGEQLQLPLPVHPGESVSILRLLTDELMENAYIDVYFKAEKDGDDDVGRTMSTNAKPTLGDVELAGGAAASDGTTESPFHSSVSVSVLNQMLDESCDTLQEFPTPGSDHVTAKQLVSVIEGLTTRLVATTAPNATEDFWEIACHSAVLQRFDLDKFAASAMKNYDELSVLVQLLMKIYQLLQVHIRYCIALYCTVLYCITINYST